MPTLCVILPTVSAQFFPLCCCCFRIVSFISLLDDAREMIERCIARNNCKIVLPNLLKQFYRNTMIEAPESTVTNNSMELVEILLQDILRIRLFDLNARIAIITIEVCSKVVKVSRTKARYADKINYCIRSGGICT